MEIARANSSGLDTVSEAAAARNGHVYTATAKIADATDTAIPAIMSFTAIRHSERRRRPICPGPAELR